MSIATKELTQTISDQEQEALEVSHDLDLPDLLAGITDKLYLGPSVFSEHGKFEPCSSFAKSGLSERFICEKPVRIVRFFAGDRPIEADSFIVAAIMVQEDNAHVTEYVVSSKADDVVPADISVEVFKGVPRHSPLGKIAVPAQKGKSISSLYRMQKDALLRRAAARATMPETNDAQKIDALLPLYDILNKVRDNTEQQ